MLPFRRLLSHVNLIQFIYLFAELMRRDMREIMSVSTSLFFYTFYYCLIPLADIILYILALSTSLSLFSPTLLSAHPHHVSHCMWPIFKTFFVYLFLQRRERKCYCAPFDDDDSLLHESDDDECESSIIILIDEQCRFSSLSLPSLSLSLFAYFIDF